MVVGIRGLVAGEMWMGVGGLGGEREGGLGVSFAGGDELEEEEERVEERGAAEEVGVMEIEIGDSREGMGMATDVLNGRGGETVWRVAVAETER